MVWWGRERSEESTDNGDVCAMADMWQDAQSKKLYSEFSLMREWKVECKKKEKAVFLRLQRKTKKCRGGTKEEKDRISAMGVEIEEITLPIVGGDSGGISENIGFSKEIITIAILCGSCL